MKTFLTLTITSLLVLSSTYRSHGEIMLERLSKARAKEMGIAMKSRKNGTAGVKVWLEFKKQGLLEKLTYTELRMKDAKGNHLVSARLQPNPVVHGQAKDLVTISFSANPAQLKNSSFMIVAYGSGLGDVGFVLSVKDFLDVKQARDSTSGIEANPGQSATAIPKS